ncbi:MAG: hypothetical protein ACOYBP_00885 [Microbacteriaceae bacterium]
MASLVARAASGNAVRDHEAPHVHRISTRLGKEKVDQICRRYVEGETAQTLADEFGVSKPALLALLRSQNVTVRGKRLSREQIAQAVKDYESGKSIAQIAKLLEFNPAAIWRTLRIQGVEMRPKGFQPKGRPARL